MSTAGGQGNVASSGSVEPASTLPWKRSPLLLKITTATAPAFFAFLILSWKVSAAAPAGPPRLISAIFPLTDAGKSVTSPNPQKTYGPLKLLSGSSSNATMRIGVAPCGVTEPNVSPLPRIQVERTSTPGGASAPGGPKFENVACVERPSTAAMATTPS